MIAVLPSIEQLPEGNLSPRTALIASVVIHLLILVGIPLLLTITERTVSFGRPPTFELVTAPLSLPAEQTPKARTAHNKAAREAVHKKAVPKNRSNLTPKEKETADEDVNELSSILNELPKPASIATVGDFKYTWYLDNVTQRISRHWDPPSGNSTNRVVVSFTIHRDGSISDPFINTSSGNGSLDNIALRAVKFAAPFATLPPGFPSDNLELTCTLIPTRN